MEAISRGKTKLLSSYYQFKHFLYNKIRNTNTNNDQQIVSEKWSNQKQIEEDTSRNVYWLAHPKINKRHYQKITQHQSDDWVTYFLSKYFKKLPVESMLTIGCGMGSFERQLYKKNAFQTCDAVDIAPGAIEVARAEAKNEKIDSINYHIADAKSFLSKQSKKYDVIWFNGSLHHLDELDKVLFLVASKLNSNGFLFLNEYVGSSRFDFGERQKAIIQACFNLLPENYRKSCLAVNRGILLPCAGIPDPNEVKRVDPSEAIQSSEILPMLNKHFDIIEKNDAGGTILPFLLCGITGNFDDTERSDKLLEMLFRIEDTLIEIGELKSDFVTIAAKAKT